MKKICLVVLGCFSVCYGDIVEVDNMHDAVHYFADADKDTLAVFDVDMCLVCPSDPAFQMVNLKRHSAISKAFIGKSPEKYILFLALMSTDSDPVLIDDSAPAFLGSLQQRGIPTMALTANLTGEFAGIKSMEKWRIDSLKALGIDFAKGAPYAETIIFKDLATYRGNYSTYTQGILLVNGFTTSKGEALAAFLAKTGLSPKKVIFVDDREEHLKSVEAALQNTSIKYTGIHFTGARKFPTKALSEAEFTARWQKLADQVAELGE